MKDYTLETLLDLNGFIIEVGQGFWVKMEVKKIKSFTNKNSDSIKYSLTLHDPDGNRLLGYDNAHNIRNAKHNVLPDHKHKGEKVVVYNYKNAEQLLTDFWQDVENVLRRRLH